LYFGGDVHFDLGELEGTPHLAEKTPLSMPALDSVEERGNDVSGYKWFFTTLEEYLYCFGLPIIASSGAIELGLTTTGGWLLDTLTSNFCLRGFDLSRVMGAFTGGPTTVTKPVFSAPTQTLVDTLEVVTEIPTQTLAEAVITRVPDYPIERVTRVSKQIIVDLASEQEAEDIMGEILGELLGEMVCEGAAAARPLMEGAELQTLKEVLAGEMTESILKSVVNECVAQQIIKCVMAQVSSVQDQALRQNLTYQVLRCNIKLIAENIKEQLTVIPGQGISEELAQHIVSQTTRQIIQAAPAVPEDVAKSLAENIAKIIVDDYR